MNLNTYVDYLVFWVVKNFVRKETRALSKNQNKAILRCLAAGRGSEAGQKMRNLMKICVRILQKSEFSNVFWSSGVKLNWPKVLLKRYFTFCSKKIWNISSGLHLH